MGRSSRANGDGTDQWLVPTFLTSARPSFSPDGSRLVFSTGFGTNANLYTVRTDGSDRQQLTTDNAVNEDPVWSPDGSRILYSSYSTGILDASLYTIKPDGTSRALLLHRGCKLASLRTRRTAARSPSSAVVGHADISLVTSSGTGMTNLTHGAFTSVDTPAFSADGTRIAFTGCGDIAVMNANGSGLQRVTPGPDTDTDPVWTSDGRIVFSRRFPGRFCSRARKTSWW